MRTRHAWTSLFAVAATAASGLVPALDAADAHPPASRRTVVIEAMRFEPPQLAVKAGETVEWINRDPFPHTVTAERGRFDSHEIAAGATWRLVARTPGVFSYGCSLHPTMRATLRVQ